ncbi:GNAT family N-acetyltransferase [Actinacidiphila yanglinensis]|uniref:GNAT family N-acetyltransferase n=1 Tax=Actinacidiphila yanglinensis TaxID=310779 RepID=UPI000CDE95C3|nr:GNAT family N-acetyltransferase [Actinacidiphila yanglinensis]
MAPVRPQDEAALAELFARCSAETVRLRFFGRPRELPRPYLDAMLAGRPETHDAVVAYPEYPEGAGGPEGPEAPEGWAGPVGLGSLTAGGLAPGASLYPGDDAHPVGELGLLVVDDWQRRGAGGAMLDTLLDRARARGMRLVSASVLTGRRGLLDVLGRRLPTVRMTRDIDALTGVYRLDAEQWAEAGDGGRGQGHG